MSRMIKTIRTDIRKLFKTVGRSQSMRITGDCTPARII